MPRCGELHSLAALAKQDRQIDASCLSMPAAAVLPAIHTADTQHIGALNFRKRILDDAERVAFYGSCARVEGAAGKFCARSLSRISCVFIAFPPVYEAGGSGGISAARREAGNLSGWCKLSVNTIFSVCVQV